LTLLYIYYKALVRRRNLMRKMFLRFSSKIINARGENYCYLIFLRKLLYFKFFLNDQFYAIPFLTIFPNQVLKTNVYSRQFMFVALSKANSV